MPDISMCQNNSCPSCNACYRYTAVPHEYRQAYAGFTPGDEDACDSFIANETANKLGNPPSKLRHIAYTQSGAWWDDREGDVLSQTDCDVITVAQDADDEQIDSLVRFRIARASE